MKKTDVYVVVDTPKKAKKLKKVLDMFKEDIYYKTNVGLSTVVDSNGSKQFGFPYIFIDESKEWCGYYDKPSDKTEISIKELRNILARDYLKDGDVVFMRFGVYESILRVKSVDDEFINVDKEVFVKTSDSIYNSGKEPIKNFIRYATEEEKALLEPKKELEVGKWYKSWNDSYNGYDLSYYTGTGTDYGFHAENNNWFEEQYWIKNSMTSEWQEATTQEAEQALIDEAKRRGFVNGGVGNNSNIHDKKLKNCELFFNNKYEYDEKDNSLRLILDADTTWTVFKDGQWATIVEQDKFAELKEAHRNGALIQYYANSSSRWEDVANNNPLWKDYIDYRIKPEENQTLTYYDIAIVERLHDTLLENHGYSLESKLLTDARMLADKIKSNIK